MRFSVLIPVYNVEKYLDQCLQSVLLQDFEDFEVILVNDGSTDNSFAICKKIANTDNRVKLYDKKNEGLLLTRRFSIKHASGEYILFLDSDDYWEPGVLSKLNKEIESSNADMICYRFRRITDEGKLVYEDVGIFPDRTLFDQEHKEIFLKEFVGSSRLNVLWSKCVKNTIIDKDEDYSAFEDKKGEDLLQSIALIRNANSILYLDEIFVNYRLSPSGRGRNFKLKYLDDYEAVRYHVYTNLIKMNVSDSVLDVFYIRYIQGIIRFMGSIVASSKDLNSFKDTCKRFENYPLYQKASGKIQPHAISNHMYLHDYCLVRKHQYTKLYVYYYVKNRFKKILQH